MENNSLDRILVTALHALDIFAKSVRKVDSNGYVSIVIGKNNHTSHLFDERIAEAKHLLENMNISELSTMLEIRILDIQAESAKKRLELLRGKNG